MEIVIYLIIGVIVFVLAVFLIVAIVQLIDCQIYLKHNHMMFKVIEAIYSYRIDMIRQHKEPIVDYEDINTNFKGKFIPRYTNILPKDKFEIIKPYIED